MSIPNYITFLRLVISPVFLLLYLEYETFQISFTLLPYLLIFLLVVSELSDAFDGFLARKTNQVTDLGKILDPMADSIARISVFLTFTQGAVNLPLVLVFIFIYRDSVISTLRTICALKGFALAARKSGKIKAVLQAIAAFFVLLLMIPYSRGDMSVETLHTLSMWVVSCVAGYTLYSGVDYIYANRDYIKKMIGNQARRDMSL